MGPVASNINQVWARALYYLYHHVNQDRDSGFKGFLLTLDRAECAGCLVSDAARMSYALWVLAVLRFHHNPHADTRPTL